MFCSQSTTAELHHDEAPGCFVHNQSFCSSRYLKEYLFHLIRFCYDNNLKNRLLLNPSSTVVRNGKTPCLSVPAESTPESSSKKIQLVKSLPSEKDLDFLPLRSILHNLVQPGVNVE